MSEATQTIYEAISAIQKAMPVIGRNKTANVGKFSYSYADLEKIWEVARPLIEANGFSVYHYGDGDKVVTVAYHNPSNEHIKSAINITQTDPQKKGAEVTYYRRYNLCMLFNIIVANEDKDAIGTEEVNDEKLAVIEEQLAILNTEDELGGYYRQLGSPKDKKIINLFRVRKQAIKKSV